MYLFDFIGGVLNVLSFQNMAAMFLYTLLSYIDFYFPWMIAWFNNIIFYTPNKLINVSDSRAYIPEFVTLCARNPRTYTPRETALVRFVLHDWVLLNYKVDAYIYTTPLSPTNVEKIRIMYENVLQVTDEPCEYAVYSFHVWSDTAERCTQGVCKKASPEIGTIDPNTAVHFVWYPRENVMFVSFNGTNSFNEIIADLYLEKGGVPPEVERALRCDTVLFHYGFHRIVTKEAHVALTPIHNTSFVEEPIPKYSIMHHIQSVVRSRCNDNTKLYFTGHSLGAGMAMVLYVYFIVYIGITGCKVKARNVYLYTYGCPRASNVIFEKYLRNAAPETSTENVQMIVNDNDIVTKVPLRSPNHVIDYVDSFPTSVVRLYKDKPSTYFNILRGAYSHISYRMILKYEFDKENYQ